MSSPSNKTNEISTILNDQVGVLMNLYSNLDSNQHGFNYRDIPTLTSNNSNNNLINLSNNNQNSLVNPSQANAPNQSGNNSANVSYSSSVNIWLNEANHNSNNNCNFT